MSKKIISGPRNGRYGGRGAPSRSDVCEALNYNPETGVFTWKCTRSNRAVAGRPAGTSDAHGYVKIGIRGYQYLAHMLAWLCVHAEWPSLEIDHINGNPSDNRIANLRLCEHRENQRNRATQRNNKLGLKGVFTIYSGRAYRARITVDGRAIHLGVFETPEAAHAAYASAADRLHGDFARAA